MTLSNFKIISGENGYLKFKLHLSSKTANINGKNWQQSHGSNTALYHLVGLHLER